jgi:flagellar hook-basal body complex protein FliE
LSNQNKNGVKPTTNSTPGVNVGEHKTSNSTKNTEPCKSLKEAMSKFQQLNISALKSSSNPFFHSSYADLTSVINAANHGAEFGLSFSQAVKYENCLLDDGEHKQRMHMSIYVETTVSHSNDDETFTSFVPVLLRKVKKMTHKQWVVRLPTQNVMHCRQSWVLHQMMMAMLQVILQ